MQITNRKFKLLDMLFIPICLAPAQAILTILQRLITAFVPAINVIVTASFINSSIDILNSGKPLSSITQPLIGVILVIAWNNLSGGLIQFIKVQFTIILRKKLRVAITEKRAKLDYKHIEDQDTWDLISRISSAPEDKASGMFSDILSLISLVLSGASVLGILIVQVWWAGILIIVVSVPLFFVAIKSGKASYQANRDVSKIQRKYEYLGKVLTNREGALERGLFGFSKKLNETWLNEYEKARIIEYKTQRKWFIRMKSSSILTALVSIFVLFVLINPVVNGVISVGMFMSLVTAVFGLVHSMSWDFTYLMDQLAKNKEYLKDLTDFAALDEQKDAECKPNLNTIAFESLEFKNVFFKYPKTENYILKGLSLRIDKDKHYSFVGINGAGKTTITKLITGLYTEYEGQILLNDKDLKTFPLSDLKAMFSAVFQDFAKYSIPLKDNISLGKAAGAEDAEIEAAIELTGLSEAVSKLASGVNTPLGKIKTDGVDISGGEWQRIAMARSIINPAPVKILDEPTASLDPISESKLYEKFEEISHGHTTIFISHRLGSTKLADIIYVLDDGKIIESGSHQVLMEQKGKYAEMFESQRSWYL